MTVWPGKTLYPFNQITGQITFTSTSAQDSAAGTGIRTLFVKGRQAVTNRTIFETVTLTGTTPSTTVNSYVIASCEAATAGVTNGAVGTITGKVGATTSIIIEPTFNTDGAGIGFTGTGVDGAGEDWYIYDITAGSTKQAIFRFQTTADGGPIIDRENITTSGSSFLHSFRSPLRLAPNSYGQLLVKSLDNGNEIVGSFNSIVGDVRVL